MAILTSNRRRQVILAIALAVLAWLGVLTFRAVTARPGPPIDYASRINKLVAENQPTPADAPDGWDEWVALATDLNTAMFEERERAGSPDLPAATGVGWPVDFATAGNPLAPAELRRNTEDFMARMAESGLDARIAAAAVHPRAIRIVPSGGRFIDLVYPELGAIRHVANYEAARMRLAAAAGDWDTFADAFDLALRPAHILTHQGFLIDHLVGYAIHRSVLAELGDHLAEVPDAATLQRLADSLERADLGPLWLAFRGERLRTLDILQHTHTDNGRGNGRLIVTELKALVGNDTGGFIDHIPTWKASNIVGVVFASKKQSVAKTEEFYDLAEAWVNRLPGQDEAGMIHPTVAFGKLGYNYIAMKKMLPAVSPAVRLRNTTATQHAQARLAVALERFRTDNGAYPQTLDQLAPTYLRELPADPSTGDAFVYERTRSGRGTATAGYSLNHAELDFSAPQDTPNSPE